MEEFKPVFAEESEFEYRDKTMILALFEFLDYRDCEARRKTTGLAIEYYF